MAATIRGFYARLIFCISLGLFLVIPGAAAQSGETPPPVLYITGSDVSSPPTIALTAYGRTGQGGELDLSAEAVTLTHDGRPISDFSIQGTQEVGTFTIFLIDVPNSVADKLPAIENVITQFANPPAMKEQVDAVAVYQVGPEGPAELLEPTRFYNSVANLFAAPLQPAAGPTALVDSIGGLLGRLDEIRPDAAMATAVIVVSDGTDAVSTQYQGEEIPAMAAEMGVPLHTVWVQNDELAAGSQEQGRDYLTQIASEARGLAVQLQNSADLSLIWNRIADFRNQPVLRYQVDELSGGAFPVTLSLAEQPEVMAETAVTLPDNLPRVAFNLPPESRTLTLPDLDDPVTLQFSPTLSWLDGVEREVTAAQLIVNDASQPLDPDNLETFSADIDNLSFGQNTIQIAVLDEQGIRATSPPLTLTVQEGREQIPDALSPGGGLLRTLGRALLVLVVLIILGGLLFFAWSQGGLSALPSPASLLPRGRRKRRRPEAGAPPAPGTEPLILARFRVLESVTRMPDTLELGEVKITLGRSPALTDITFENDITVSRIHATLMLEGNHYRIFDEGSTSGTWVNEKAVPEYGVQLVDGDEVHLGAVLLRFRQP